MRYKTNMFKHLSLAILTIIIVSGCATVGPTVLIETPEPTEDFVVYCRWSQTPLLAIHGGGRLSDSSVYLSQSGEIIDCGLGVGESATVMVMHPIYTEPEIINREGVSVYRYSKTRLNILDDLRDKFESGFWGKLKHPGFEYAYSLPDCRFDLQYLDYYNKVQKVEMIYFKQKYHEPMFKCLTKTIKITKKYRPAASSNLLGAKEVMQKIWHSDQWSKYD